MEINVALGAPAHSAYSSPLGGSFTITDTWLYTTPPLASPNDNDALDITLTLPEGIEVQTGVSLAVWCFWVDGISAGPLLTGTFEATFIGDSSGATTDGGRAVVGVGAGLDLEVRANISSTPAGMTVSAIRLQYSPEASLMAGTPVDAFDECTLELTRTGAPSDTGPLYAPTDICGDGMVTGSEECDGGECCTDVCRFEAQGVACGDNGDNECDAADTCDGAGACALNLAVDGTACDTDTFCLAGDVCTAGVCTEGTTAACAANETCVESTRMCMATVAPDAGMPDAGMPDVGMPDAGMPDAGMPDAGAGGPSTGGNGCSVGAPNTGSAACLCLPLLGIVALRRRSRLNRRSAHRT